MDRLDLAIALRSRLGDWFKVEKLLRESGGDDVALVNAWNKIGAYYSERQKWAKAAQFYTQVGTHCAQTWAQLGHSPESDEPPCVLLHFCLDCHREGNWRALAARHKTLSCLL